MARGGGCEYRFRWLGLDDELVLLEILRCVSDSDRKIWRSGHTLKVIFIFAAVSAKMVEAGVGW